HAAHTSCFMIHPPPTSTLFPYTTLFRSDGYVGRVHIYLSIYDNNGNNVGFHHLIKDVAVAKGEVSKLDKAQFRYQMNVALSKGEDRKSSRLNSSHQIISYAVFCLKKKI